MLEHTLQAKDFHMPGRQCGSTNESASGIGQLSSIDRGGGRLGQAPRPSG
jgi:hypothetical protein